MQFSGPPRNFAFAQANGGSTNTTRDDAFHALLLSSEHY